MRILVDCDGVLADFISRFLSTVKSVTGLTATHEDIVLPNAIDALGLGTHRDELHAVMEQEGWCASIPMFPDAARLVSELKLLGDVRIVIPNKAAAQDRPVGGKDKPGQNQVQQP